MVVAKTCQPKTRNDPVGRMAYIRGFIKNEGNTGVDTVG